MVDLLGDVGVDFGASQVVLLRVGIPQLSLPQLLVPGYCPDGFFALALGTAVLVLNLRLLLLGSLQTDLYGDIEIVYNYVRRVLAGEWPLEFVLSAGPLDHYTVVPILALTGLSYFSLKLAAVIVSLGVLAATYALSRRLIDDYFALLAVTIAGVSSWLLIWSRLGNSQIIVPLLATVAIWLTVRVVLHARTADLIACAAVSALGLYAYPQRFVLPGVTLATLLCLSWAGQAVSWAQLRLFVLVTVICTLPFAGIVYQDPHNFTGGYIGGKLLAQESPLRALLHNFGSAALAFHVRGDVIFRSNLSGAPHLDLINGELLLAGVLLWLRPARRRWCAVLLVPFELL
jgi:4-amino-4-deoxy-L-arabinose transferase-like glycosyltransferase